MKTVNMLSFMKKYGFEIRKDFYCKNDFYNEPDIIENKISKNENKISKTKNKNKISKTKDESYNKLDVIKSENETNEINYIDNFCLNILYIQKIIMMHIG